jgi:hypothetical protein
MNQNSISMLYAENKRIRITNKSGIGTFVTQPEVTRSTLFGEHI